MADGEEDKKIRITSFEIPLHKFSKDKRGFSENFVKKSLERKGYLVFRPEFLHLDFSDYYPNVKRKYVLLGNLLEKYHPGRYEELRYINHVHHGMPDFLCFKDGKFLFIECKLNHEPLLSGQRKTISRLFSMGFPVEIYRLVHPKVRARRMDEDVITKKRRVIEK